MGLSIKGGITKMDQDMDQNDVMLSSAEDLNNEMDFGMEPNDDGNRGENDEELEKSLDEIMQTEEPEDEPRHEWQGQSKEEEPQEEEEPRWEKPVEPKRHEHERRHEHNHEHDYSHDHGEVVTMEPVKVNRWALAWMIILTVILAGVVGMMIYAWIIYQQNQGVIENSSEDNAMVIEQNGSSLAIAGALEVYLDEINLSNYDSDIVIVNNGGSVKVTGELKHTLYVNNSSDMNLILTDVKISTENRVALVNVSGKRVTIVTHGTNNKISAAGENKYGAVVYSDGLLDFDGDGRVIISALGENMKGIASKNGFNISGGEVISLSKTKVETPMDDSAQGYFSKEMKSSYAAGANVTASVNSTGVVVADFVADADFSSMLVSNSAIKNNELYVIDINGGTESTE